MKEKVSAIVLSGGQGRRFGNADKGLVSWQGKPLIEHVVSRLQRQADQLLISCNRNTDDYRLLGFEVFTDLEGGYKGPLAGVQAAANAVMHPWCLLCPNDIPLLPENLISLLLTALQSTNAQVAYPVCGTRHHFLPALVRSELLPEVTNYLQAGGRSLHGWYKNLKVTPVDFTDQDKHFINVNSPSALSELSDTI